MALLPVGSTRFMISFSSCLLRGSIHSVSRFCFAVRNRSKCCQVGPLHVASQLLHTSFSALLHFNEHVCSLCYACLQAGGTGSTGQERVLDICPEKVHQRVPLFVGSPKEVAYLESYIKK